MGKLEALEITNRKINKRISIIEHNIYDFEKTNKIINTKSLYKTTIYDNNDNGETSFTIFRANKGQKTDIFFENEFNRLICIKGKIRIFMPEFNEEIIMTSLNTILIPPQTKYIIEILEDTELIDILKPQKIAFNVKNIKKTIYNKIKE